MINHWKELVIPIISPARWRTVLRWTLTEGQIWTGCPPGSRWWSWCCCWGGRGTWRPGPSPPPTPAQCRCRGRWGRSEQQLGTYTVSSVDGQSVVSTSPLPISYLEISNIPKISLGRLSRRKTRTTASKIFVICTSFRWAIVNPKDWNLKRNLWKFLRMFFFVIILVSIFLSNLK